MEKEFVEYSEALALRELGFDEPCLAFYNGKFLQSTDYDFDEGISRDIGLCCKTPTFSQAFRFFREKYNLDGKPEYFLNDWYCFIINDMKGEDNSRRLFTEFPSYEEAELACLTKLIEIVKVV